MAHNNIPASFAPELYPYVYRSVYYYTISATLQNAELIVRGIVERRRVEREKERVTDRYI